MAEPIVRNYTTEDIFTAVHTKGPTVTFEMTCYEAQRLLQELMSGVFLMNRVDMSDHDRHFCRLMFAKLATQILGLDAPLRFDDPVEKKEPEMPAGATRKSWWR